MLFEEDDFVLKPISILNEEFSMAIHPTAPSPTGRMRPNAIPHQFKEYAEAVGGIGDSHMQVVEELFLTEHNLLIVTKEH